MQMSDTVTLSEDVVAREVAGETVLLNLASGTYFGLNAIGGLIWKWLDEEDGCSLADISQRIAEKFDISSEDAQRDVLDLAKALAENGLLETESA